MPTYDSSYDNSPITRVALTDASGQPIPGSSSGTGDSADQVQGTSAAGVTTTQGNPVRGGAKYKATPATRTDGQTADLVTDANENLKTTLATALDEDIDSATVYDKSYTYTRLSADGAVSAVPVGLAGYYVEASSTGVISLYDNASAASGNAMLALSKAVTANELVVLDKPIAMTNGVYFDLVSGTATVSILTRKLTSA